jgi:hypothetical protein
MTSWRLPCRGKAGLLQNLDDIAAAHVGVNSAISGWSILAGMAPP